MYGHKWAIFTDNDMILLQLVYQYQTRFTWVFGIYIVR